MLPAADAPQADPASAPPLRLLVVDDDALSRSLQARLLALLGHCATVVDDPDAAIDAALSDDIDGMLLDLGMPGVDGFTLLARLREAEAQRGRRPLPVIAVTGYAASADRLRCLMAGFNDHLCKPIDVGALGATLARHITRAVPVIRPDSDAVRVEAAARRLSQVKPQDAHFGPTLLEAFAMRSGQLIEEITAAQRRGDHGAIRHSVRSLRASAEFMGASGLAQLCERLLAAADAGDCVRASTLVAQLVDEHQGILALLLRPGSNAGSAVRAGNPQ